MKFVDYNTGNEFVDASTFFDSSYRTGVPNFKVEIKAPDGKSYINLSVTQSYAKYAKCLDNKGKYQVTPKTSYNVDDLLFRFSISDYSIYNKIKNEIEVGDFVLMRNPKNKSYPWRHVLFIDWYHQSFIGQLCIDASLDHWSMDTGVCSFSGGIDLVKKKIMTDEEMRKACDLGRYFNRG